MFFERPDARYMGLRSRAGGSSSSAVDLGDDPEDAAGVPGAGRDQVELAAETRRFFRGHRHRPHTSAAPSAARTSATSARDDGYDAADRLELLAGAPASRAPSTPSSARTCSTKPSTRPSASTTSRPGPLQDGVGGGKKT